VISSLFFKANQKTKIYFSGRAGHPSTP